MEMSLKHFTDTPKRLIQAHRHSTYLLRSISILTFQLRLDLSICLLPSNFNMLPRLVCYVPQYGIIISSVVIGQEYRLRSS